MSSRPILDDHWRFGCGVRIAFSFSSCNRTRIENQAIELRALTAESERDEDQSIDPILEDMADAHKTSPDTVREILRLASIELQNAHSEHAFSMDGESADHGFA